ncbi:hypothetical protein K1719_019071 [Acacia pycnantha]|nr:hypothetical protein K1719_019071 [Acacia pycnantha]
MAETSSGSLKPPSSTINPIDHLPLRLHKSEIVPLLPLLIVYPFAGNHAPLSCLLLNISLFYLCRDKDGVNCNLQQGAMDSELLQALYWKGVPVFDMDHHMSTKDFGWGSPTFHKMGREKVILINSLLPFGFELLMCDTVMVWLKVEMVVVL